MKPIQYLDLAAFRKVGFRFIYAELTANEPAPNYEDEANGMAELEKVLEFVQNDVYYPSFEEKCAYLICSISGSQYFSNGNKRLSVMTLIMFLLINHALVLEDDLPGILHEYFPKHRWEEIAGAKEQHALLLYNLAIVLGDRTKWESNDFTVIRELVASMFSVIYEIE